MKEQGFFKFPFMPNLEVITEQNNAALKRMFKDKIKGYFLIDVKDRVMKVLGFDNLIKYYDFGWLDYIDEYYKAVKKSPYSVYGIITFLKDENKENNFELEWLEKFYKSCHAYTHGSIQIARYPVLHYFEISIMLYFIIRKTFLLLCKEKKEETMIDGQDIISMIDRDFDILYNQYKIRSTERFDRYYNLGSSLD